MSAAAIDKLTLLSELRDALEIDIEIDPDDSLVIDRSLDSSRFQSETGWTPPTWRRCSQTWPPIPPPTRSYVISILTGKRIVVTGGTGSLGRVLVQRLLGGELGRPDAVVVFSRDEAKQHAMRLEFQHRAVATDECSTTSTATCTSA